MYMQYNENFAISNLRRNEMADNKYKEKNMGKPIEKHVTAAWANIESKKPVSDVTIPSEIQARNAKEYVDTNEK